MMEEANGFSSLASQYIWCKQHFADLGNPTTQLIPCFLIVILKGGEVVQAFFVFQILKKKITCLILSEFQYYVFSTCRQNVLIVDQGSVLLDEDLEAKIHTQLCAEQGT